jgi:hypothetical protein
MYSPIDIIKFCKFIFDVYVTNLLSFRLLSKDIKIRIYKTIILPVVLYMYETWSLTLREEHRRPSHNTRNTNTQKGEQKQQGQA